MQEIAVISMNDTKLEKLAAEGDKCGNAFCRRQSPRSSWQYRWQSPCQAFWEVRSQRITLRLKLVSALAGIGFYMPQAVAVILITIILSYFTLVFGELVPKRLAMKKAEKLALGMAGMLYVGIKDFAPLVGLLTVSTNGILRLRYESQ